MELLRALGVLAEAPSPKHRRLSDLLGLPGPPEGAAYADLFLMQLPPYASIYVGNEGMLGGEARDRVAGFWEALGHDPPDEPDHLSSLLGLAAALAESERREEDPHSALLLRRSRAALLWEHLLPWLPPFLARVEELGGPFYSRWAALLQEAVRSEVLDVGTLEAAPRHLAGAASLPDPREHGAGAFLAALFAPVRSGLILVRRDLSRAAADLGTGLRAGERTFAMKGLLSEDPGGCLDWLGAEARRSAAEHSVRLEGLGMIRSHWVGRARSAARLLASLTEGARAGVAT